MIEPGTIKNGWKFIAYADFNVDGSVPDFSIDRIWYCKCLKCREYVRLAEREIIINKRKCDCEHGNFIGAPWGGTGNANV